MLSRTVKNLNRCFVTQYRGMASVGFIGLGNMGGPMAANLIKKGNKLVVFDVSAESIAKLTQQGAVAAATPAAVAEQCDTIVTMLPSPSHVTDVFTNKKTGILSRVRKGALLIDSSTIDPGTVKKVSAESTAHGAMMIDAPVSGGVGGATAGTLAFMVGGQEAAFERAKPYLQAMGKNIFHCGEIGSGQVAKIANNLVLAISMAAVSEGMNLGVKLGMDPTKLASIINTSSGRCWSSDTYNPCPGVMPNVPSSRGYTGGFGVDLMKKDLGLALQAAQDSGAALPIGSQVAELYQQLSKMGWGGRDFSVVYEFLNQQSKK